MNIVDITTVLISDESIRQKLPSIFVDSIMVDQNFNIVMISQNVLDLLNFSHEEVWKKNINSLAGEDDLTTRFRLYITSGYFNEKRATLFTKTNQSINVSISGFYLGLISDINGYIILKIRNLQEVELMNDQLRKKTDELDKFIYQTAHDLRGPLATMKGLLNLLKIRENNDEVDRFLLLLDAHANKLDERLFQLVYLAQADQEKSGILRAIDFSQIETSLRRIIEKNAFVDFLEFDYSSPSEVIDSIDDVLLSYLLINILLYLLSLPMKTLNVQMLFRLSRDAEGLNIAIKAQGLETNPVLCEAIQHSEFIYTDMIHFPQLMNFYAAQKIASQLDTKIKVQFLAMDKQQITILIPFTKGGEE